MTGLQAWIDSGFLTPGSLDKLQRFAALIRTWNARVNLTGCKSIAEIEESLIGESVAALAALKLQGCSVLDFGSGAGIPGLVWAICEPSLKVTSLEIRQKKVAFQKEAARRLDLNAEILQGHFPEAVAGRRFGCIVSRGIRFDAPVWRQAEKVLEPGGVFVRFASAGQAEAGWRTVPVSERSSLLLRPRRDVSRGTNSGD